jgi:hypothetical protein
VVEALSPVVRQLSTERLMTLRIADRPPLWLGHDVPPVTTGAPFLPAELGVPRIEGLEGYLARPGSGGPGSAARDWARLEDRMNFISALFCSRILLPDLLVPPFTAAQVEGLRHDQVPPDLP